ncbi:MAG: 30S ribosomal protein S2 [Cyclobacteriaceae bacterium]
MSDKKQKELLDAGVHFGHLTSKWDPRMAPYIFMEKNGIHIIDLNKTVAGLEEAKAAVKNIVKAGRKILFVATKKQAKLVVEEEAGRLNMPFVTERWLGGMLTNFTTVRKSLKKMSSMDKLMKSEMYKNLAKRERLMLTRDKEKLEKVLGGIADQTRLPSAMFVVDVKKEHIAIAEAKKLNIPVFALVDTNSNPEGVDYVIPGNDDAFKSISVITKEFCKAIEEGLSERKAEKSKDKEAEAEVAAETAKAETEAKEEGKAEKKAPAKKTAAPKAEKKEVPAAK